MKIQTEFPTTHLYWSTGESYLMAELLIIQ